jgi:hypothetical protein
MENPHPGPLPEGEGEETSAVSPNEQIARVEARIRAIIWLFRYPDGHQTGALGLVAFAGPGFVRWFNAGMDFAWLC